MTGFRPGFDRQLLQAIPDLRAYAQSLCRDAALADDIVQDALLNAWRNRACLREPDRIKPWLLAILRNAFLVHIRRTKPEVEDVDGSFAASLVSQPEQPAAAELSDVRRALAKLPFREREAIALVCIDRLSYEEASEVCGCPAGTIKSRVNRARAHLLAILKEGTGASCDIQPAANAKRRKSSNASRAVHSDTGQSLSRGRPSRVPSPMRRIAASSG
ncbi:MAG: sigma-70 family RNA polymerase sigma factor [Alphaproteobacteria bacterium]|nr:sigma-70 family RNA polymerase sigma factor [Alphaproteobacteria bacterium]